MREEETDDPRAGRPIPSLASKTLIRRPRLEDLLDEALGKRLTAVVASAGFGKSTLLASWTRDLACAWYTIGSGDVVLASLCRGITGALQGVVPQLSHELSQILDSPGTTGAEELLGADAFAGRLCELLERHSRYDVVLVVDDVHELGDARASARLLEGLCRQAPQTLHLVLSSRTAPPFPVERLRGQGEVLEIDADALAFDRDEVDSILLEALGEDAVPLAGSLQRATGGWPAAVRLATETLRGTPPAERETTIAAINRPEGPLFPYLAREVFDRETAEVRELMQLVAPLGRFNGGLCEALGVKRPAPTVSSLVRRGLLVQAQVDSGGWFDVHQLIREFVQQRWPLDGERLRALHRKAASWFERNGLFVEALASRVTAADPASLARFLELHGAEVIGSGGADQVIAATETIPSELRSSGLHQVLGEAYFARDELDTALACFERSTSAAPTLDADLAWLIASVHYNRGDFQAVIETCERAGIAAAGAVEQVRVLTMWSNAQAFRGEISSARSLASRAFEAARAAGSNRGLAFAQHALGVISMAEGDNRQAAACYRDALETAGHSGETMQLVRGSNNLAYVLIDQGAPDEALDAVDTAIGLAELPGFRSVLPYALDTRGRLNASRGRLEDALTDFAGSIAIHERRRSHFTAEPLVGVGDIHRERGNLTLARAAYEEAITLARQVGILRAVRGALAGLARVEAANNLDEAQRLLDDALSIGDGEWSEVVLIGAGWVAVARDDLGAARELVQRVRAGALVNTRWLAEALELQAVLEPHKARRLLEEAHSIWNTLANPLGAAKVELALGHLAPSPATRARAEHAERRLRDLGVKLEAAAEAAGLLASLPPMESEPVAIRTLGGFRVLLDGRPVPSSRWQSRKARDLLKLLVARRGHPVPRETVMEALWPGEDPVKLANRFSVALSVARSVLDSERAHASDHFIRADGSALSLDHAHVDVDVGRFLAAASAADTGARDELEYAESLYAGDFLEEDLYEDWAVPLREEARTTYISVARRIAERAAEDGDYEVVGRYLRRVLERDPYDERAHLGLVHALASAGQHGEARRAYRRYCRRMEEIGVEATPFPAVEKL